MDIRCACRSEDRRLPRRSVVGPILGLPIRLGTKIYGFAKIAQAARAEAISISIVAYLHYRRAHAARSNHMLLERNAVLRGARGSVLRPAGQGTGGAFFAFACLCGRQSTKLDGAKVDRDLREPDQFIRMGKEEVSLLEIAG
jgi:hypothetical protein